MWYTLLAFTLSWFKCFPCWTTLCLEIWLTFKPYSPRHVLSARMSTATASGSGTLLGLLLHDIMPVQALQSHIRLYLVSSRMKYRQQFKAIDLLERYTWFCITRNSTNRRTCKPYWHGLKAMGRLHEHMTRLKQQSLVLIVACSIWHSTKHYGSVRTMWHSLPIDIMITCLTWRAC